jgi:hypothetical protein
MFLRLVRSSARLHRRWAHTEAASFSARPASYQVALVAGGAASVATYLTWRLGSERNHVHMDDGKDCKFSNLFPFLWLIHSQSTIRLSRNPSLPVPSSLSASLRRTQRLLANTSWRARMLRSPALPLRSPPSWKLLQRRLLNPNLKIPGLKRPPLNLARDSQRLTVKLPTTPRPEKSTGTAHALVEWPMVHVVLNSEMHSLVSFTRKMNQRVSTVWKSLRLCSHASESTQIPTVKVRPFLASCAFF